MSRSASAPAGLSGGLLILAGFVLAFGNFMVVLDVTIANVAVSHISGSLGVSPSEGTWVLTSYAVAEAIVVPLTGWLAKRFGEVKFFVACMAGFGLFSFLCGIAGSLGALIFYRVAQGVFAGPIMPMSQTLLLRIFPKQKHAMAMGVWSMTTITAPVLGPILGGTISDSWGWNWIFFVNVPIAVVCSFAAVALLRNSESRTERMPVDGIGLALLVVSVGALQVMLDLGQERDWFEDSLIVTLAIVSAVTFVFLLAWELMDRQPIVDLKVFRHRGFAVSVVSLLMGVGVYYTSLVVIPLWLQNYLGYTATWAGDATAFNGILACLFAPLAASLSQKVDSRILVSGGIVWLAATTLLRVLWWNSNADFWTLALASLIQGAGLPFFFVPLTTLALGSVEPGEVASAAGVMNFLRTMASGVGTAIGVTMWENGTRSARDALTSVLNGTSAAMQALQAYGLSFEQAREIIAAQVENQAAAISVNAIAASSSAVLLLAAAIMWLAPKPKRAVKGGGGH